MVKPVIHMPDDPRTLTRASSNTLTFAQQRVLDYIRKWPGITMIEIDRGLKTQTAPYQVNTLLSRGLLKRKRIKTVDGTGFTHYAWALYVKKK